MIEDNQNKALKDRRRPEELEVEIIRLAKAGDFPEAERLRGVLLENHPMALSAIIATAEVIEEEKTRRIDQDHLAIWDSLYGGLSQEEKNCLFYATKSATVAMGKVLLRQGKPVPRLLFVDSGRVTLFHTHGEERILLGQLSRGDVLGEETFFGLSTPTFSAGAQTEVHLRYLDKSATGTWEESQPGLFHKLADYCLQHCRASLLLHKKNIEKRVYPRMKADCKVAAYVSAEEGGMAGESFRGSLVDLSQNGASFEIHCSRAETAQVLLGRPLTLELLPAEEGAAGGSAVVLQGTIVKVGALMHNDYTIHVRLHAELPRQEMEKFVAEAGG